MPEKFKMLTIEEQGLIQWYAEKHNFPPVKAEELINGTYIPPMSDEEIIRRARLEKASEKN